MNITDFLLARIEEDEADAQADAQEMAKSSVSIQFDCATQARFTPARVLAECAVKRAVVENLNMVKLEQPTLRELRGPLADVTLRQLAAVYSDHPDYRPEWTE